jgi:hypothetical protein
VGSEMCIRDSYITTRINDSTQKKELFDSTINGNNDRRLLAKDASLQNVLSELQSINLKDFATELTLNNKLQEVINELQTLNSNSATGGATEAKQDIGNTILNTIANNTTTAATQALQTTGNNNLVTINNKLPAALIGGET